jgi:hypothetical protein
MYVKRPTDDGDSILERVLARLVILVILGNIIPLLVIRDNIESFPSHQRTQASQAWREARSFIGGTVEPLFVRGIRVERVADDEPRARTHCRRSQPRPPVTQTTEVFVRYYTAFGLPWSGVHVVLCDGQPTSVIRI